MSADVMIAVLFGALLHAIWNALVRGSPDRTLSTVLVAASAGAIAACWLPFAPLPASQSWPYLAASVVIHIVYFALVAFSYRKGELSFVYPIMRGMAPVLSAIVAALLFREYGTSTAIAVYIAVSAFISLVCVFLLPDNAGEGDSE